MLDPTDSSVKCLSLDYDVCDHILILQIQPTGTVSRISLMMSDASTFLPSSDDLPSAQSTAAPIAPDSMLTRLDRLCESLGDTLREVVIALLPLNRYDLRALQADPVKPVRGLRDQMPSMSRSSRLSFRMLRDYNVGYDDATRNIFGRDEQYWTNIVLNDSD